MFARSSENNETKCLALGLLSAAQLQKDVTFRIDTQLASLWSRETEKGNQGIPWLLVIPAPLTALQHPLANPSLPSLQRIDIVSFRLPALHTLLAVLEESASRLPQVPRQCSPTLASIELHQTRHTFKYLSSYGPIARRPVRSPTSKISLLCALRTFHNHRTLHTTFLVVRCGINGPQAQRSSQHFFC